jgi:hypothetical protein
MKISMLAVSAAVAVGVLATAAPAAAHAVPDDFRYLVHEASGLCVANVDQGKAVQLIECDEHLGWDEESGYAEPAFDHNQHWWFIPRDGHHVAVNHLASIQAEDFVVMTGARHKVTTAVWDELKQQKWTLIHQGDGWSLKNAKSGKCLAFGGYGKPGDTGTQAKCDGSADQTFAMPFAHPAPPLELP